MKQAKLLSKINCNGSTENSQYSAHNHRELEALARSTQAFPVATTNYIYDIQSNNHEFPTSPKSPGVSEAIKKMKKVRRKMSRMSKRPAVVGTPKVRRNKVRQDDPPDWIEHVLVGSPV